jgi:hypothetical protein
MTAIGQFKIKLKSYSLEGRFNSAGSGEENPALKRGYSQ